MGNGVFMIKLPISLLVIFACSIANAATMHRLECVNSLGVKLESINDETYISYNGRKIEVQLIEKSLRSKSIDSILFVGVARNKFQENAISCGIESVKTSYIQSAILTIDKKTMMVRDLKCIDSLEISSGAYLEDTNCSKD